MKTQKIKQVEEAKGFYERLVIYFRFLLAILIINFVLIVIISCSRESMPEKKKTIKVSEVTERSIEADRAKIASILEPPEPEEVEQEIEIGRPDITTEDIDVVVEDVAVDAPEAEVVMPNVLSVKPSNSALVMPALFSSRSGSGRKCALSAYGGSSRSVFAPLYSSDRYTEEKPNVFRQTTDKPLSTVSIDVDTASYANVRRFLTKGQRPPTGAVRVEDFINYFQYDYPEPKREKVFSVYSELSACPWDENNQLLLIGLKGKQRLPEQTDKVSNYVFLIDVSGSMGDQNKLPLLKRSLNLLIDKLADNDRIAIVTYASNTKIFLESSPGKQKKEIKDVISKLSSGGCTYGESGIKLAYKVARENFIKGGNNRVILATDGDFNVGVTDKEELKKLVESKKESGVFLTVIGMGGGNLNDAMMESISNHGNGNYYYIDSFNEARKVFTTDFDKNMFAVAKDVKIQIEFNPVYVAEYKLIGYVNRVMKKEDFNNDKKDAGEIGNGHTVTYLYEIILAGDSFGNVDPLKYQPKKRRRVSKINNSKEMFTLKIRYKKPDQNHSVKREFPVLYKKILTSAPSVNFNMASAAAALAMRLKQPEEHQYDFNQILRQVTEAKGKDKYGYRSEFMDLVKNAREIY